MDKEKEIEEELQHINELENIVIKTIITQTGRLNTRGVAKALYNAGYGNVKQAVREFAEKERKVIQQTIDKYFFNGNKSKIKAFTDISTNDFVVFNGEINSKLDELLKERYGEDGL